MRNPTLKLTFTLALALTAAPSFAYSTPTATHAHPIVYVENNVATADGNAILAYERDDSGKLTPLAGSPFATGGQGFTDSSFALGPFDADQQIVIDSHHHHLFAVNTGSNTIAVFNIDGAGKLTAVAGSPFPSGGINPVSVGLTGNLLTVVNKRNADAMTGPNPLPNYTNFWVGSDGKLSPVAGSRVDVAIGSSPSQALATGYGQIFGADFLGGLLQSFAVTTDGRLWANSPTSLPDSVFSSIAAPRLVLGLATNPRQPALYAGFVTASQIGVYSYDRNARLKFVKAVPNSGMAICWIHTNDAGSYFYTSNTGDHSISTYDSRNAFSPSEVQKVVLKGTGAPFSLTHDQDSGFVYVIAQRDKAAIPAGQGNEVHVLKIDAQTHQLTETESSPLVLDLPGDTRPQGIAVLR